MQRGSNFPPIPPSPYSSQNVFPKHVSSTHIDSFLPRRHPAESHPPSPHSMGRSNQFSFPPSSPFTTSPFSATNTQRPDERARRDSVGTNTKGHFQYMEQKNGSRPPGRYYISLSAMRKNQTRVPRCQPCLKYTKSTTKQRRRMGPGLRKFGQS